MHNPNDVRRWRLSLTALHNISGAIRLMCEWSSNGSKELPAKTKKRAGLNQRGNIAAKIGIKAQLERYVIGPLGQISIRKC
jgi:hypothetical protein